MFREGKEQSVLSMMYHRDERLLIQEKLLQEFKGATLITLTLNIPGPIKNNTQITHLMHEGVKKVCELIDNQSWQLLKITEENKSSGIDVFIILSENPFAIKKHLIDLEEHFSLGRFFDMDVQFVESEQVKTISRMELGSKRRLCFVCEKDAKLCARSQSHTIKELQETISEAYQSYHLQEKRT